MRIAAGAESLETISLAEFPDTPFLIAGRDQVIRKYVGATGQWEPGLAGYIASLLSRSAHVVIGGGHVGLLAFQLWRARPDVAEIVAFEPDSVNAALLATNILSWGDSPVCSMPLALGERSELLSLAQNPFNTGDNRLWDTIPADLHAGGGDPAIWPRQPVVCAALDHVWGDAPLDLIFLDAQGWEPDVLRGAERLLTTRKPVIVFEWWPRALVARGLDLDGFLGWLERDLGMTLGVVPPEASGFSNPAIHGAASDIERITELLLSDPDPAAYVELVASHGGVR
jgi:FkbM family methyltransferase